MSDLPENWTSANILELSKIIRGVTYSKNDAHDEPAKDLIPILRAMNVTERGLDFDDLVYVPRKLVKDEQIIKAGDVIAAISSGSITVVGKAKQTQTDLDASFGAFCAVLRPVAEIDPKYFGHFFGTQHYRFTVSSLARGVNINNLKRDHFEQIEIPFAPLDEQKRIAEKLDTLLARVDSCQTHLERVPQILKRFRQSVLAAATSGRLTEDWREEKGVNREWDDCSLGDVLTDIRYGTAKKSIYELKDGIAVLRIPNVVNGKIDASDLKYSHFDEKEIAALSLKTDDILLIRSNGSIELVGKVAIVDKEFEGYVYAGYLIRLRFDTTKVNPRYISYYLSSPAIRSHIELTARSTSGVNNINSEEVKAIFLELPSLEEQAEIVRRVEKLFAYAERLEARYTSASEHVERLTPSLLAKAFRGELVEQEQG